jgi:hypothetical protein
MIFGEEYEKQKNRYCRDVNSGNSAHSLLGCSTYKLSIFNKTISFTDSKNIG